MILALVYLLACLMIIISGDPKALLIATDVAARGLDIPNVQHVIHYQVPKTSEVRSQLP